MLADEVRIGWSQFAEEFDGVSTFRINGFHEVILSVRNVKKASQFYQNIARWEEVGTYETNSQQMRFWSIDDHATGNECLLTCPGASSGHVRLIQYDGVPQRPIRTNSQSWDTGGIFDLDLRAKNLEDSYLALQKAGWSGFNDPMSYEFEKFHVSEVLMKGPDDVVLAIIERHRPPLTGYDHLQQLSEVFNSSQIVKDMDVAKDFYINVLGFKTYIEETLNGSDEEQNLFGMPQNFYKSITRRICILHPDGNNTGSIELVQLDGAQGNDFSNSALPPNLGIMALRFPTHNLEALNEHFFDCGVSIERDIATVEIPPYGKCSCMVVKSPDGAWLEFIELENN